MTDTDTNIITKLEELKNRADTALHQVNHRDSIDLKGFDSEASYLCALIERHELEENEQKRAIQLVADIIRTLDRLEQELSIVIQQNVENGGSA